MTKKAAVPAAMLVALLAAACSSGGGGGGGGGGQPAASTTGGGQTTATSASSPGAKSTIVIGNVGDFSGTAFASAYEQDAHSLQAWAAWTNANGGLNGHPVKIVSYDDQANPALSLKYVKQMVEQDHVVAIAAPLATGTDTAWASYVQSVKLPVIGGASVDPPWETNPYMLAVAATTPVYLSSQLAAAKTVGTTAGELACAELAACHTGVTEFGDLAKSMGLGWGGTQFVAQSATSYVAQCDAMKNAGVNVVIPELAASTITRVMSACAAQGYKPAAVLPASDIDSQLLATPAFNGSLGVNTSPLWFGTPSATTKTWYDTYTKMFPGDELTGYANQGWQAGVVIAAALKNAPPTVTSQTILQGLYALPAKDTFGGWTPPLTFTPGKPTNVGSCMWYVQIKNGQLTAPKGTGAVCISS
jgi:branched-chain amino acid transport system substrate-binding protein